MNKILRLLQIPIVKFIGIAAVIYFALFSNHNNPNSLPQRLSFEQISKNVNDMSKQSRFIISNVKDAQKLAETGGYQKRSTAVILIKDIEVGKEGNEASCGDEVDIAYEIRKVDGQQIKNISSERLIIGSKLEEIIEQNVIGMKKEGIRSVLIPHDFESSDPRLREMLGFYNSDLKYQISLLAVTTPPYLPDFCK